MNKKIRLAVFVMLFFACLAYSPQAAYAEPETESLEGGESIGETEDSRLSSLEIAQALLNPEFNPEQLTYTAVVPNEVTRVALLAETMSPEAKKIINGTSDLQVGENTVVVLVTAADGSTREYRITVTREAGGGEAPGTDPGVDPGANPGGDPGTDPGVDPGTDPGASDPMESQSPQEPDPAVTDPEEAPTGQTFPAETTDGQDPGFVVDDGTGSAENASQAQNTRLPGGKALSGRNLLLLVLAGFCLLLVCIIVALLLLRRRSDAEEEFDDDEDDDEYDPLDDYEEEDNYKEDTDEVAAAKESAAVTDAAEGKAKHEDAKGVVTPEELAKFYQALNLTEEDTPEAGDADLDDMVDLDDIADLDDAADIADLADLDDWEDLDEWEDPEESVEWEDPEDLEHAGDLSDPADSEISDDPEEIEILDLEEEDDFLEEDDDFDFLDV